MRDTKMSSGGERPLSLCHYHRCYDKEAAKCKTGTNGEQCEFQKLSMNRSQSGPDDKQIPDLRNLIKHDKRNSLRTDLRVHLNQGAGSRKKRPKQEDLRSRISRPRAREERSRAEIEDNVVEENLFERRGNKQNPGSKAIVDHKHGHGKLIHVSELQVTKIVVRPQAEDAGRRSDLKMKHFTTVGVKLT